MVDNPTITAAFWGFLGAIMYAGPSAIICYYSARESHGPWSRCIVEACMALVVGTISAAAFGTYIAHVLHQSDSQAISALVGVMANPLSPRLVALFRDRVMKRLETGLPPS